MNTVIVTSSVLIAGFAQAQTSYLLDFNDNDASGYPTGTWNVFAAPADVTGFIQDSTGSTAAGVSISQTGMSDSSASGTGVFENSSGGPSWATTQGSLGNTSAVGDYFFTSTSELTEMSFTLSGLNSGDDFTLELFASRETGTSTVSNFSYSLDGGSNWLGFSVLELDGTASTANGWDTNTTISQTFDADADGFDQSRYMSASGTLTGTSIIIRGVDAGNFTVMNAAHLTVIPEPSTTALLISIAVLGLSLGRRRK